MRYLLALGLAFACTAAMACDCLFMSMRENYRKADFVLRVHVLSLQDTVQYDLYSQPIHPPFQYGAYATVRVQQVFKGKPPRGKLVLTGMGSMCDFRFKQDSDYVVFLYKQDVDAKGHYVTSSCQRHFSLDDAATRQEVEQAWQLEK